MSRGKGNKKIEINSVICVSGAAAKFVNTTSISDRKNEGRFRFCHKRRKMGCFESKFLNNGKMYFRFIIV